MIDNEAASFPQEPQTQPNPAEKPDPTAWKKARQAEKNLSRWLFITFLALYFLTMGGHLYSGDGFASYATARSFLEGKGGALDGYFVDTRFVFPGPNGQLYSKYGLGQVLVEIPFVLAVKVLAVFSPGLAEDSVARFACSFLNVLVGAACVSLLYGLARKLGSGIYASTGVALLYGLATMNWTYSKLDFSEPLLCLCYIGMAHALFSTSDAKFSTPIPPAQLLKAGAWLGLAATVKPVALLAVIPAGTYLILRSKKTPVSLLKTALWVAGPLVLALGVVLLYNLYRYGKVTETGYSAISDQFAAGSVYGGIFGFLFSPGKSIFLYAPGLLLALFGLSAFFKRRRAEAIFGIVLFLTCLLFYSLFWNWEGDWTWGPRYLMPAFPFIVLWATPLLEKPTRLVNYAFRLTLGLGILVNLLGTIVEFNYYFYVSSAASVNQDWRFVPELSPVRGQLYLAASALNRSLGGPSLQMDYPKWDPERVHARTGQINMAPYDQFDLWWLRPANPATGASNALGGLLTGLVIGLIFGGLTWVCWRKTRRARDRLVLVSKALN